MTLWQRWYLWRLERRGKRLCAEQEKLLTRDVGGRLRCSYDELKAHNARVDKLNADIRKSLGMRKDLL